MAKRGKKYNKAVELVNSEKAYSVQEAVELLSKTNTVKFDPSVEIHFNLNLDTKHADQIIRTTINLPNGSGKKLNICAFTDWNVEDAKKAWAVLAWGEELIDNILKWNQKIDFDICVATPTIMRHIGKIAKLLWPKWLMPNPKTGTVSPNIESAIKEIAWWKFEFKTDKQWNVHSIFWKLSFWDKKLEENLSYFIKTINDVKPTWSKWIYINSIFVCNSMWPSIKIEN